jgi:hypothetical protein
MVIVVLQTNLITSFRLTARHELTRDSSIVERPCASDFISVPSTHTIRAKCSGTLPEEQLDRIMAQDITLFTNTHGLAHSSASTRK